MDLLQRLIAESGTTSSKQHRPPTHQERLGSCKRLCNALFQIWRTSGRSTSLNGDETTTSHIFNIIRRLNTILEEESRKAAPHSCLKYTASNQVYLILTKLAVSSNSPEVIEHTVQFFRLLINGEIEAVLDQMLFARATTDLVRHCLAPATIVVDLQGESALIELLFDVCTKIRLDPDILPAWFYPERRSKSLSVIEARRQQFPLFYILVDYVHYDGPVGDFARTALLYLTETAPRSRPLEKWMMESDLAHQMASGLSALYARLSRQAPEISKKALPILCFSDLSPESDRTEQTYENLQDDMRAFLAYLAFWQDTLSHCKSIEVRDTLIDAYQLLFVEQLLYPSLLESSDVEGGSTSAVILHLCRLLEALDHEQLVSQMLHYLFATKSQPAVARTQHSRNRMSLSRRKSMDHLANLASLAENPSPELFNLLDLIIFSLRSSNPQTVSASLRLITTLLRRHHPHVKHQLLSLEALRSTSRQNLSKLNDTMMTLFDQAAAISEVSAIDQSYQAALKDAQSAMEHHSCLFDEAASHQSGMNQMGVASSCRILGQLSALLESWFGNDTLINLELTGSIMSIAACEHILMRTWLDSDEEGHISIIRILKILIEQVTQWRSQFIEWDTFLTIQKVELASEEDAAAFGGGSKKKIADDALSTADTAHSRSPPRSPRMQATRVAQTNIGSIDGRIASDGSTAVQSQMSRKVSIASQGTDSGSRRVSAGNLSKTLLETRLPIGMRAVKKESADSQSAIEDDTVVAGQEQTAVPQQQDINMEEDEQQTASLRHILTQAIVLQEFILELAAALQIRATLFDEVELS